MSDPHPAREDKRSFLQKLAEFIHPGPDSKDELIETLVEAEDNRIINAESRAMLEGVIRMADLTAGDAMVAAPRMELLSIDAPFEEMLNQIIDTAHSRFPVYEGDRENIIGILMAKDLLKLQRAGKVKHFGVSGFNVFQQRLLSQSLSQPIIANQLDFNLLEVSALKDGRIDFIKEQYSSPIASSPLANGRIFQGQDDQAIRLRRALIEVGRKYDANVEQTAVAWLQKLGALPLIGTLEKHRIQNAATASNIELTHEDWYYLLQQAS